MRISLQLTLTSSHSGMPFSILSGKKHPQIKLQRFPKQWIWTFGWLVYQINSICKILHLKQNFRKNKVTTAGAFRGYLSVATNVHVLRFFQLQLFDVIFVFPKRFIFRRQKRAAVMDACSYFQTLNSTGVMMSRLDIIKLSFEVPHSVQNYTKMRIPSIKYRTYMVDTFWGTWCWPFQ